MHNITGDAITCQREGEDLAVLTELPPGGSVEYTIGRSGGPSVNLLQQFPARDIRIGRYLLSENDYGLCIIDDKYNRPIFTNNQIPVQIVAKEEVGTLWTEEFTGQVWFENAGNSKLEIIEIGELFAKISYKGAVPLKEVAWSSF